MTVEIEARKPKTVDIGSQFITIAYNFLVCFIFTGQQ